VVSKFIKNGSNLLMKTQKTILSAAFVIAFTYGLSAILSLVRSRLLAGFFGTGDELAVFYTADKIPSFVYSLLVVGTISTVFIPVFTNLLKHDKKAAWRTASAMISISVLVFVVLGVLVYIFAPNLIRLLSVWRFDEEQVLLGTRLMRLMISAQLILIISSFVTSLLQSFKYFVLPALAPVVYNLGMIGGILFLTPQFGIFGPAYGVLIGAVLHLLVQLPLLKRIEFKYKFALNLSDKGIREIISLVPPRIFGSALVQVSSIVNNSIAILVSTSSVVVFRFADQLQSFPVNLFGASMALAALPTLSFEADEQDKEKFKKTFLTSFHQMLFLAIPASVILLVLRVPLVRLVFGAANFPWEATVSTAYVLAFFSFSIFAQSSVYLLTRAFFALKDTATPVKVNFFTILLSTGLSLFFINVLGWGVWAVAFSYSIAAILDALVLLLILNKKVGGFGAGKLITPFTKISYSAVLMGISLYAPLKLLDQLVFDTTRTVPLILLTGIAGLAGTVSYLFFTLLFKVEEIELFYRLIRKLNITKKTVVSNIPEAITE
jgi:putative peptidoglycan lipid II flippase